ncbi:hypothetical protein [Promicromonospora sp. NPDC023805]|uniref:hypothetical protein n=1 Tax=Promicromonospora sp. NPDC023805 TaxID=3154696 RepID=UPI00340005B5
MVFVGRETASSAAERILRAADGRRVRIYSDHETLVRDLEVAAILQTHGLAPEVQSPAAVRAGTDKRWFKELLERAGIVTPAWGTGLAEPMATHAALRKHRNSTQSQGIRWDDGTGHADDETYWEQFIDGVEYSVVAYRTRDETTVLPVVWKGRTRQDLLPPWRRLRLTPPPGRHDPLGLRLASLSRQVGDLVDAWGFFELEVVVTADGTLHVLELNPRVSGTLRIAAMAAAVLVFAPHTYAQASGVVPVRHYAAEVPYAGAPVLEGCVVATSRITVSGQSPDEVRRRLAGYIGQPATDALEWAEQCR